ncbi:hypothetical protein [Dyella nitratireducens]|uniref:DUF883 domain-containing protein n=1 Tax=Dyella nitratireducens TaxID=1849580 RepID=A0ABQ1GV49_9GAMM|nr:hypothetical protein [Dyella nitratireducens]GGA50558.1 hypothetical protein GCM10010981_44900 [Dyella nitratireducens]GLQ42605.1 hypothetical protein GCM10007902_24550 [Dyella nitratireducens]
MSRQADIERRLDHLGNRVREYADGAADTADNLLSRGCRAVSKLSSGDARRRMARRAEDFADEANYQYRRLRRHAGRHPVATAAIVAGTVGALFLLYRTLRRDED